MCATVKAFRVLKQEMGNPGFRFHNPRAINLKDSEWV